MKRLIIAALLCTVVTSASAIALAQAPSTSPADYVSSTLYSYSTSVVRIGSPHPSQVLRFP